MYKKQSIYYFHIHTKKTYCTTNTIQVRVPITNQRTMLLSQIFILLVGENRAEQQIHNVEQVTSILLVFVSFDFSSKGSLPSICISIYAAIYVCMPIATFTS